MKKITESDFKRLVGVWKTSGEIISGPEKIKLEGIDTYEFILDGTCLLHKAKVVIGDANSETLEIIRLEDDPGQAKMHYFNSKGEEGFMTGNFTNNEFGIDGKSLMFRGTINSDNSEIAGKWYSRSGNDEWSEFIELKLEKKRTY